MGLDGTELKVFVRKQQALAREEREKERQAEKERLQAEKEKIQYEDMFLMEQEAAKERDGQLTYYTEHTKRMEIQARAAETMNQSHICTTKMCPAMHYCDVIKKSKMADGRHFEYS